MSSPLDDLLADQEQSKQEPRLGRSPIDELMAQAEDRKRARQGAQVEEEEPVRLRERLHGALSVNPDQAAKTRQLAERAGVTTLEAEVDPERVERSVKMREVDPDRIEAESPVTGRIVAEFPTETHDDTEEMSATERAMTGYAVSAKTGLDQIRSGDIGLRFVKTGEFSAVDELRLRQLSRQMSESAAQLDALGANNPILSKFSDGDFGEGLENLLVGAASATGQITPMVGMSSVASVETSMMLGIAGAIGGGLLGGPVGVASGFGAGFALGGIGGLVWIGEIEAGGFAAELLLYRDEFGEPLDRDVIRAIAIPVGIINGFLERFGIQKATVGLTGRIGTEVGKTAVGKMLANRVVMQIIRDTIKDVGVSAIANGSEEFAQGIVSSLAKAVSFKGEEFVEDVKSGNLAAIMSTLQDPKLLDGVVFTTRDGEELRGIDAIVAEAFTSMRTGVLGGGGMALASSLAGQTIQRTGVTNKVARFAHESERKLRSTGMSKLRERNPEAHKKLVREALVAAKQEPNVNIEREGFRELFSSAPEQYQTLLDTVDGLAAAVREAEITKSDIVLDAGEFWTTVAHSELGQQITDNLRPAFDLPTPAQVKAMTATVMQEAEALGQLPVDAAVQRVERGVAVAQEVYDAQVRQQMAAGETRAAAEIMAEIDRQQFYTRLAEQPTVDPLERVLVEGLVSPISAEGFEGATAAARRETSAKLRALQERLDPPTVEEFADEDDFERGTEMSPEEEAAFDAENERLIADDPSFEEQIDFDDFAGEDQSFEQPPSNVPPILSNAWRNYRRSRPTGFADAEEWLFRNLPRAIVDKDGTPHLARTRTDIHLHIAARMKGMDDNPSGGIGSVIPANEASRFTMSAGKAGYWDMAEKKFVSRGAAEAFYKAVESDALGRDRTLNQPDKPKRVTLAKPGDVMEPQLPEPTAADREVALADTRPDAKSVSDRMPVIVPERIRVADFPYKLGRPDTGGAWDTLTDDELAEPGPGFDGTDADIAEMWEASLSEVSAAAKTAVAKTGAHPAKNAAFYDAALRLPLSAQIWYERSGEKFRGNMLELSVEGLGLVIDLIGATSAREKPTQNLLRALAVMSQYLRGEPIDVDLTNAAPLRKAIDRSGDLAAMSSLDGNKTGQFSNTIALTAGLPTSYPFPVNDVWVGVMYGVSDDELAGNQALHEVIALHQIKLRDFVNKQPSQGRFMHESWGIQSRSWVEIRPGDAADDYAEVWPVVLQRLLSAGVPGVVGDTITEKAFLSPEFAPALRATMAEFRESTQATIEFGTTQNAIGKKAVELYEEAKTLGVEIVQRQYLQTLAVALSNSSRGKPTIWQKALRVVTGEALGLTRIQAPTKDRPFAVGGSFEKVLSPNIRVPLHLPQWMVEAYHALAGKGLGQDAMASSKINFLEAGEAVPAGMTEGHSVFVRSQVTGDQLALFAAALPEGHDLSFYEVPNGTVININPRFEKDDSKVGATHAMADAAAQAAGLQGASALRHAHDSVYTPSSEYAPHRKALLKRITDEAVDNLKFKTKAEARKFLKAGEFGPSATTVAKQRRAESVRSRWRQRLDDVAAVEAEFAQTRRDIDAQLDEFNGRAEKHLARPRKDAQDAIDALSGEGASAPERGRKLNQPPVKHATPAPKKAFTDRIEQGLPAFDASKFRSGTGGFMQGAGIYFAEAQGTHDHYMAGFDAEVPTRVLVGGADPEAFYSEFDPEDVDQVEVELTELAEGRFSEVADAVESLREDYTELEDASGLEILNAFDAAGITFEGGGTSLEVDIQIDTETEMLQWDAMLSEQPAVVVEAIKKIGSALGYLPSESSIDEVSGMISSGRGSQIQGPVSSRTGEQYYRGLTNFFDANSRSTRGVDRPVDIANKLLGKEVSPNTLNQAFEPKVVASAVLAHFGVKGNRYLDQNSRASSQPRVSVDGVAFLPNTRGEHAAAVYAQRAIEAGASDVVGSATQLAAQDLGDPGQFIREAADAALVTLNKWQAEGAQVETAQKTFNIVVFADFLDKVRVTHINGEELVMSDPALVDRVLKQGEEIAEQFGTEKRLASGVRGSVVLPGRVGQALMNLTKSRDLSTWIHESAHIYFWRLRNDVARGIASESQIADLKVFMDWLEVDPAQETLTDAQEEQFAEGFERFMQEGISPTIALSKAFRAYKRWITQAYAGLRPLSRDLTDEVRGAMGRILATGQEMGQAEASLGLAEAPSWMSAAEKEGFNTLMLPALAKASAEQLRAKETLVREEKKELQAEALDKHKARVAEIRKEVVAELAAQPVWEAREQLEATPDMPLPILADFIGLAPNQLEAELKKVEGVSFNEHVDKLTNRRARAELGRKPRTIDFDEMARENISKGDALRALMEMESAMAKRAGLTPTPMQLLKNVAEQTIENTRVRDLAPKKFEAAAEREFKAAQKAALDGDFETARNHQRQQVLAILLQDLARKARDRAESTRDLADSMTKPAAQSRIGLAGHGYIEKMNYIINRFDFSKVALKRLDAKARTAAAQRFSNMTLQQWMEMRTAEAGDTFAFDPSEIDAVEGTNWKNLTVGELEGVRDAIKNINHLAINENKILAKESRAKFEARKDAVVQQIMKTKATRDVGDRLVEEISNWQAYWAQHRKLEFLFLRIDDMDGAPGVAHETLFQPLDDAMTVEMGLLRVTATDLKALRNKHYTTKERRQNAGKMIFIPEIDRTLSHEEIMATGLNRGNIYNDDAMKRGMEWSEEQIQAILRHLMPNDARFIQGVWDLIDGFWPEIAKLQRELTGVAPEKVKAHPVEIAGVMLKGGYYPLKGEPRTSTKVARQEEKLAVQDLFESQFGFPGTRKGHTINRQKWPDGRPLRLDLHVLDRHISEVIHDIAYRKAIIDANKMLSNSDIEKAIKATYGPATFAEFRPWLQAIARDQNVTMEFGPDPVLRRMRGGTAVLYMGMKFTTMFSQPSGISNSIDFVGEAPMLKSVLRTLEHPITTVKFIFEHSEQMHNRQKNFDREARDILAKNGGGTLADQFWLSGVGLFDMMVSVPTWLAGYNNEMEVSGDAAKAAIAGDRMVRLSQGSGAMQDLARIQRGPELQKIFTMFASYFVTNLNQMWLRAGSPSSRTTTLQVFKHALYVWWAPVVLAELMSGRGPGEDDDDIAWWVTNIARAPLNGMIGIRDVANAAYNQFEGRLYGFDATPSFGIIDSHITAVATIPQIFGFKDEDLTERQEHALVETFAFWGHAPGSQIWITFDNLRDWFNGETEFEARDLLFTRQKERR